LNKIIKLDINNKNTGLLLGLSKNILLKRCCIAWNLL